MSTEPDMTLDAPARLRIERGRASAEDIAVLTALFAALESHSQGSPTLGRRAGWSSPGRAFNLGAVRGAGWGGGL
ncbi:MAG: acyl-CoA carboxylase subunit epsilon [Dermatophilaceae bacterium]